MTDPTTTAPLNLLDDDDDTFEQTANPGAPSSEDFEDFDMPAPMCGLVRGHVSDVKPNPAGDKLIIELKSEEPETSGSTVSVWIKLGDPRQRARLCTLAASVGLPVGPTPGGGGLRIGGGGTKAMKNKPCMFVVETYSKDDGTVESSVAWGMPKPEKSDEWKAYAEAYNDGAGFTEEQVKAIKAGGGIIPVDKQGLFN